MKLTVLTNTLICGVMRLPKLFCCYIAETVLINTRWCEAMRLPKLFCCHSAGTVLINTRWCEVMRLPSLFCGLNAGSVLACSKVHRTKGNISQRPATMFAVCNQWHGDTEENELAVRGVVYSFGCWLCEVHTSPHLSVWSSRILHAEYEGDCTPAS